MAKAPKRSRDVYFAGAGLSCALGLPNTASLLHEIASELSSIRREALYSAYRAFYPDGDKKYFVPDTVDFFSALQAHIDIGAPGLPGVELKEARELMRELKLSITRLLITKARAAEASGLLNGNHYLQEMIQPGNAVVTTNWDVLIERYANLRGVRVRRLGQPANGDLLLLKLHGSIDWTSWSNRKEKASRQTDDFANLADIQNRLPLPASGGDDVVRIRALENWSRGWQRITGRTHEPFLVTMYRGKGAELTALSQVWADAYHTLSRARKLEIAGYSLPSDDLEIRTLLRAGLKRGRQSVQVTVRNPAPDVHARIRQQIIETALSDYRPI